MLQIDDAHLPMMYDNIVNPGTPDDFRRWARLRIDALNHALEGIPAERCRYHICWGSFNSPARRRRAVPRDRRPRARRSTSAATRSRWPTRVTSTSGGCGRSSTLPDEKVLIPGVIAHTTNVVEHPELVAERIVRLAELVGRERVIGGTDCGFAQGPYVRRVHPTIMWAKLDALVQGARLASERLW